MISLNTTKQKVLLFLKMGGIAFIAIIMIFIGIKGISIIKTLTSPPSPPDAKFGNLPEISFPEQKKETINYSLDTISGYLPTFSDRAKIYQITIESPTLMGLGKTQEKVALVGFKTTGARVTEDNYQWADSQGAIKRILTMNIFSFDFTLSSSFLTEPSLKTLSRTTEKEDALKKATSFVSDMGLLPKDIDDNKTTISTYSITNNSLITTSKISDTKIVKVDFFQKDIDKLPIYYQEGTSSTMNFLIGKIESGLQVVDARFFHKNISENYSTYYIKTAAEAYSQLKNGDAYIASKSPNVNDITIKNVFLAYYVGEDKQEYLMPIIVFQGNNDFIAYVSAVKDELINK